MDQTLTFQRIIQNIPSDRFDSLSLKKSKVSNPKNGNLDAKLRELVSSITCMRDYLIANKKDYINIYSAILSMSSSMTDEERDQIDREVQDFVKLSNDVIKILRVEAKSKVSKQQYDHVITAINMVEAYNQNISEIHNRHKALRLKRNLDSQNFFRLSRSIKKNNGNPISDLNTPSSEEEEEEDSFSSDDSDLLLQPKNATVANQVGATKNKAINQNYPLDDYPQDPTQSIDYGLTPEEQQLFKQEGNRIYDEMNMMNREVKDITKKLVEISKLQEIFSDNVIKQDIDLNNLNASTIQSTEYIREGNEQLREAMRKNAGFRVWILFFITTLAFVILFLDWYNA